MTFHKSINSAKQFVYPLFGVSLIFLFLITSCAAPVNDSPTVTPSEPDIVDTPIVPEEEPAEALITKPTATSAQAAEPEPTLTPPPIPAAIGEGDANVLFVSARLTGDDAWSFSVTVEHNDTGWEDYADGWDVLLPNGEVLLPNSNDPFTRLLLHPHENEQPFTRSQSNIVIPADVTEVTVRAHDLVDGFGGQEVVVDLTAVSGQNFEVDR